MPPITITKDQASRLWTAAMGFNDSWRGREDRFETYGDIDHAFEGVEDGGWTFHWCPTSSDQVLLEAFFVSEGHEVRPLWDLAYEDPYVVLAKVRSDYQANDYYWKV